MKQTINQTISLCVEGENAIPLQRPFYFNDSRSASGVEMFKAGTIGAWSCSIVSSDREVFRFGPNSEYKERPPIYQLYVEESIYHVFMPHLYHLSWSTSDNYTAVWTIHGLGYWEKKSQYREEIRSPEPEKEKYTDQSHHISNQSRTWLSPIFNLFIWDPPPFWRSAQHALFIGWPERPAKSYSTAIRGMLVVWGRSVISHAFINEFSKVADRTSCLKGEPGQSRIYDLQRRQYSQRFPHAHQDLYLSHHSDDLSTKDTALSVPVQ